jgi:hypothetical protein
VARRKQTKRPKVPSSAEILSLLRTNFYALIGLQTANAKNTEASFAKLDSESRESLKTELTQKFAGLRPDQIEALRKQKSARSKKTR